MTNHIIVAGSAIRGHGHIWVMDDEEMIRDLAMEMLYHPGTKRQWPKPAPK